MARPPRADGKRRRAVRRAEDFYVPPPQMRDDAWDGLRPAERVIAYMERVTQRSWPRPKGQSGVTLIARIDAGRWVVQCPDCDSAQVVSPEDTRFWCVTCQPDAWTRVRFPADPAAVEESVASKPARDRFWWADDDTSAFNKPRVSRPLTPKELKARDVQDSTPPPPPDPVEEPPTEGEPDASGDA
ncbi:hypothetical protein [Streptomyces sp. NBC_00306]|uniref:hypothetical protein n=1 Tax=Streptomyces sp. NBC_00306 TaxID=2975708 RepID=UPI002E2DFC42|nr:hypothetical protein [Streptomyces sp. NBC_00306]